MAKGTSPILLLILGIAILGLIAGAGIFISRNSFHKSPAANTVTASPTLPATPTNVISPTTESNNYPGTKEFSSPDLKIAFNYLPAVDGTTFTVKEIGNKVYISTSNSPIEQGQFVEVFPKDSQDTLAEAVKKKFLAGKSEKQCFVINSPLKFKNYPPSYQAVEISFPKPSNSNEPWWSGAGNCSPDYAQSNGLRYFLGDSNHPKAMLFFNIGQYGIMAGPQLPWQDTIRFLD